jgi:hypothetical protein
MTTRDKVLAIRAELPDAHAAQIARLVGVTSGRPASARPETSGSGWSRARHTSRRTGRPGGSLPS